MPYRSGGKIRGTHTTLTDLAVKVVDIAVRIPEVVGISPGLLQSGKGVAGGSSQKVKFSDFKGGFILTVRQARSVQELRVYSGNVQVARTALARALRDEDIPIAFKH